jgi:hypothetical protein
LEEGSGATPLATQDLFFGDAISTPTAPTNNSLLILCGDLQIKSFQRRARKYVIKYVKARGKTHNENANSHRWRCEFCSDINTGRSGYDSWPHILNRAHVSPSNDTANSHRWDGDFVILPIEGH